MTTSIADRERILIVAAHSFLRRALRRWLEAMFPACEVTEATDGEQAIVAAKAGLPEVVLLDVHLSGLTSLETRAALVAISPTMPVVMLTGYEVQLGTFKRLKMRRPFTYPGIKRPNSVPR